MEKKHIRTIKEMKSAINGAEAEMKDEKEASRVPHSEAEAPIEKEAAANVSSELSEKLSAMEALAAENLDKYQRTLAEFDNFRKRTQKEKASMYDDGASDVLKALLPVIDSFERALASVTEAEMETPAYTGMSLIYKQLRKFMDENGITEIEAKGQTFNPELHQAIAHVDDPEFGVSEIIDELQKGYMLKDRVIRYSMVKVAN